MQWRSRDDTVTAGRVRLYIDGAELVFLGKTKKEAALKVEEAKIQLGKGLNIAAKQEPFARWRERLTRAAKEEGSF